MSNYIYHKLNAEERTRIIRLQEAMMNAENRTDRGFFNSEIKKIINKKEI
ncbi:hypothetical protein K7887_22150 (plasmid) [Sutcliffiella horikoshii]|nr:hypothetical protein [Sutcliffiella horikoshii]UAL49824.1 hypothetical protein K7887_22150 [Sutcliffiella horikoshii]